MIERKKKLRIIQIILLITGILIIYFTYYDKKLNFDEKIISNSNKENIEKQVVKDGSKNLESFINVEYTGLDLSGNRYVLKSKEAILDESNSEIVYMKFVDAVFYFKDDTTLYVKSDTGTYNNKTLDMKFKDNVNANYLSSELFADKATYSNSKSYLSIDENVRVNDIKGNLIADKLLFDLKKQKLDITSFNNGKINANVRLDEKRF